jgi:hypothetical protein
MSLKTLRHGRSIAASEAKEAAMILWSEPAETGTWSINA